MPAPIAKGIIIAASVIVAAGIALYEVPQVRQWVDHSRRKIAIALHNLGDGIQPKRSDSCSPSPDDAEEAERRKREDAVRRRRSELIRKAREDGVAVDLDELAKIGTELQELQHPARHRPGGADRNRSFDELVGDDGRLKKQDEKTHASSRTTGAEESGQDQMRFRGRGMEGFGQGSLYANPFADEESQVLYDRHLIGAEENETASSIQQNQNQASRESSVTLSAEDSHSSIPSRHLTDLSNSPMIEATQTASIHSIPSQESPFEDAIDRSTSLPRSFHSTPSSTHARSRANTLSLFTPGDATPTDDGFSTAASVIGSNADDVAALTESLHSIQRDDDAASDMFSETGFSEVEAGQSTPGSWTDVDTDAEGEMGMH